MYSSSAWPRRFMTVLRRTWNSAAASARPSHMAAIVLRGSVSADELEDDPVEARRLIAGRRVAGVGHDHEARALARDSARRRAVDGPAPRVPPRPSSAPRPRAPRAP